MANKRIVTYKCLYCNSRFNRKDLVNHISEDHEDMIPEGFTALRLVFNYVNKKPLDYHGKCTECGSSTPWDENKGRYDRQCGKKACHDSYIKKFEDNMMKTRGTTRISSTAEGQKKMLANRKISGTYVMRDGAKKTYTGSYELKALEFMDKVMELKSDDILCPGPILEYSYNGETHIYITDFYYQPYNLIIEVKDGGNNPNKRNMPEYRAKQIAKEQYLIKHTNYNYLRLTNNNLRQLLSVFADLKYQLIENTGERVIHVNENNNPILEFMNALMSGKVVGLKDSEAYIVNIPMNNVFSKGITDAKFTNLIIRNPKSGILENIEFEKEELLKILSIPENANLYKIPMEKYKVNDIIYNNLGKEVSENFIYEAFTGKKLYTYDQYELLDNIELESGVFVGSYIKDKFDRFIFKEEYSIQDTIEGMKNNG